MNALVVYDSAYGNTEKLARVLADALGEGARVLLADQVQSHDLAQLDLLLVGSPTQGGRPTRPIAKLIGDLPSGSLQQTRVAAFDTRLQASQQGFGLRLLMKVIGYAAPRIARSLQAKGGRLASPPEGFIVQEKEGPLKQGELERAASWAESLVSAG
jgi:flavodoxin